MKQMIEDTIVATASAVGAGRRAVVRLSGSAAIEAASRIFRAQRPIDPARRRWYAGDLSLPEIDRSLPGRLLVWPAPRSYTGQPMAEIHLIASRPLVDLVVLEILRAGARPAEPGEFTLRAFLHGRRDLSQAEAVQAVVSANSRDELRSALTQLAGGVRKPLEQHREELLNLLADVEAGLDFVEEDITFVSQREILLRLTSVLAHLTTIERQLRKRAQTDRPMRVVLVGETNAGKSSLFNAIIGTDRAMVSSDPGTTRDYVSHLVTVNDISFELVDTAGWHSIDDLINQQSQQMAAEVSRDAELLLLCVEAGRALTERERTSLEQNDNRVVTVATKCDLGEPLLGMLPTSVKSGLGIQELKDRIIDHIRERSVTPLVSSISRCQHHIEESIKALRRAHSASLQGEPPEVLAMEIRSALDELGAITGAIHTEDLLDRIFSRFCIGK